LTAAGSEVEANRPRVLVRERIAEKGMEFLRGRFDLDVDLDGDLDETIGAYDGIVIRSATRMTAELIEKAVRLKVIGRAGVGVDNVDLVAASQRGIVVVNAPESTVVSAAGARNGLLFALSRSIPQAHAALKEGRWERSRFAGIELAGKTLGIIGLGRIGQQVARRAEALEMRVVAYDPYVASERFRELAVERAGSLVELSRPPTSSRSTSRSRRRRAGSSGARSLRPRRTASPRQLRARRAPRRDALVEALQSGKVAAAALDVFQREPYSGPLLELDNVVVTPHLAASTREAQGPSRSHRRRAGRRPPSKAGSCRTPVKRPVRVR
jgi:D-3-phosphoglycerate dehydrogenase